MANRKKAAAKSKIAPATIAALETLLSTEQVDNAVTENEPRQQCSKSPECSNPAEWHGRCKVCYNEQEQKI